MSRHESREQIFAVRLEGFAAAAAGQPRASNPYSPRDPNHDHWQNAYDTEMRPLECEPSREQKIIRDLLEHAVYDVGKSDECIAAVAAAKRYLGED